MPNDARNHYSASRISDIFTLQYKISDPGHIKENLKESLVRHKKKIMPARERKP